jgi:simple sugar transport system ATP-binding protein
LLNRLAGGQSSFFLSKASIRKQAADIVAKAGFSLDLDADFGDIGAADRQLVAIARAIAADAKLLILDEPTASLSQAEAQRLFTVLRDLQARGIAIIYISHRIADLQAIADRVVVLRGGVIVADLHKPVLWDAAIEAMIGRTLDSARVSHRSVQGPLVLNLRQVRLLPGTAPIDLQIRSGEVVAITGHLGAGKSRLLRTLFGLGSFAEGAAEFNGKPYAPRNPAEAIAQGVCMAAEDRHRSSLLPAGWPGATVAGTISLPHLQRWFPSGWLRPAVERQVAEKAITRLGIKTRSADAPMETLSGGNQQKVVLARWQSELPHLLLLDEPFQGVDVGARADIIAALRADKYCATLIATSDPEEALEVADRIYTLDHHALYEVQSHAYEHAQTLVAA